MRSEEPLNKVGQRHFGARCRKPLRFRWPQAASFSCRLSVFALLFAVSSSARAAEYTTYIGDAYPRNVAAITADAVGNTYILGNRGSASIPTAVVNGIFWVNSPVLSPTPTPTTTAPPNDVFVSKLDPIGKVLFTDVFAGKGLDKASAITVDGNGNVYIGGTTTSLDFPVSNAVQSQPSQFGTGFIVKISPDGKSILYSTYFGGLDGSTAVNAMMTDPTGNLYVAGTTFAGDFPHTAGMPSATVSQSGLPPTSAAFVAALSTAGDKILFAGTIGGTETACSGSDFHDCMSVPISTTGVSVGLDASRNVYFGGNTNTINLPTTAGALLTQGIGAFVGKIGANGANLAYLTYLGSTQELANGPTFTGANVLSAIAVDPAGEVYLAGSTGDPKFPATSGTLQTMFAGGPVNAFGIPANTDGFIAKLNSRGSALVWATYLGGNGNDAVNSISLDAMGNIWADGTTASTDFSNVQGWSQGGDFLVELNASGSALSYSARYPSGTLSEGVALDGTTLIHTAGSSGIISEIVPNVAPITKVFGVGNAAAGPLAGRIAPSEVISLYGPHIGPATAVTAVPTNGFYPTTLGNLQVMIGGFAAPLLYVSDGQINAVVPSEVSPQGASTIQIISTNASTSPFPVWVDVGDAQIFSPVLNQDWSINSRANPAKSGSVVIFYSTGSSLSIAPFKDGQIATGAANQCANNACVAAGASVLYGGPAPGIVAGAQQFNLQLSTPSVGAVQQVPIFVTGLNTTVTVWVAPQ